MKFRMRIDRVLPWFTFAVASATAISTAEAQASDITTWKAIEQWRIDGTEDGDGFGDLRDILTLANGDLWVLDFKDQVLHRYDARGKPLGTVSRMGSGPGELRKSNGMLLFRDGSVWLNDPPNSRFSVFDAKGKFSRQITVPITGYGYVWQAWLDKPSGTVMDPYSRAEGEKYTQYLRRVDSIGKVADEAIFPNCGGGETRFEGWNAETRGKGSMMASYPFLTGGGNAADGKGAMWCATVKSRRAVLVRIGKNDTISTTTVDVPPISVPRAERDFEIASSLEKAAKYATNNFDAAKVPAVKPGIGALWTDADGRLWVQHGRKYGDNSTIFDVHDGRGKHLGRLTIPLKLNGYFPLEARGSDLWVIATDEDDVPSVVKLRIAK